MNDPDPELMEAFKRQHRDTLEAEETLLLRFGFED